jgi:hypothetical protein
MARKSGRGVSKGRTGGSEDGMTEVVLSVLVRLHVRPFELGYHRTREITDKDIGQVSSSSACRKEERA